MNCPPPRGLPNNLLTTSELLHRAKTGDQEALERLMARYRPRLVRWATGRLPMQARSLFDTGDLVQETLLRAIQALDGIESGEPGRFQAYVRQAVLNRIRDQIRWAHRHPNVREVPDDHVDGTPSPLEEVIESDVLERYERSLAQLNEREQLLVHLRLELDFGYGEIAAITGVGSPDAARMAVRRSVRKLGQAMGRAALDAGG